jgi:predicted RNA binding protein with dsRBD fold (UPF0201 family)
MGNYNPHAPYVIGQEWVPIRNAHYLPDGITERGYTFRIDHTAVPVSGAFYVNEVPGNIIAQTCDFISIYPTGREHLTGPVKSVRIKPSAITVTNPGSIDATEGVAALLNPGDRKFIIFDPDTGTSSQLQVSFDTDSYAQVLLDKRIVDVRLHYVLQSPNVSNADNMEFRIHNQAAFKGFAFPDVTEITNTAEPGNISTLSITELNPAWDSTVSFRNQRTVLPWRFQELNRFRASAAAAEALTVFMQNNATVSTVLLGYLELEVLYCEETRVLYGGFRTYDNTFSNFPELLADFYNIGAIAARLYSPVTFTQGATLTPGEYTVTIYHRDMSSLSNLQGTPKIHAVRGYYELPTHRGVQVNQTTTEGDTFTVSDGDDLVLPHLTLHTSSTIVTGVHAYGTSYGAPVYASHSPIQEIEDDPVTSAAQFPQVRFYARRFGETTVPLTLVDVATGLSTVSISVTDFDALDEIVDGWREVNLRFASPPTFSAAAGDVDWRWQAAGEAAGNQWQILVADGPTGSWQPSPTAAATGPATYYAPQGSTVTLSWQSPSISGTAEDTTSDAVLIFSQDPPAVTGFALTTASQPVTGLATLVCAAPFGCIPTGIGYNQLTWNGFGACDTFDRVNVDTWNNASTGQAWTNTGGAAGDYDVDGAAGTHLLTSASTSRNSIITAPHPDQYVEALGVSFSQVATGNDMEAGVVLRHLDTSNRYFIEVHVKTDNSVTLHIHKQVAGVITDLADTTLANVVNYAGASYNVIGQVVGTTLRARAWQVGGTETPTWQLTVTDASLTAAGSYGVRSRRTPGNTNVDPVVSFAGFRALNAALSGGQLEVQRSDALTDWQTIMLTDSPDCVNSLSDFEARVGVTSWYRIRTLNALDFAGPWVTGSATLPSPGVQGAGDGNSVLIFTSNAAPSSSLAYVMQWEGQPVEQFAFPEAEEVALQQLYGRDFVVALRPLERGGERFQRVILVNNAAITLPSLANFRGLRDLAWADLDYVCVRDELGNRWFATVVVPAGDVRDNRRLYLASVSVIQVTETASVVDPADLGT